MVCKGVHPEHCVLGSIAAVVEMIEKRVIDGSVLRLIGKWIKVGVIEDGRLLVSETGTGQGQPISPLPVSYTHLGSR